MLLSEKSKFLTILDLFFNILVLIHHGTYTVLKISLRIINNNKRAKRKPHVSDTIRSHHRLLKAGSLFLCSLMMIKKREKNEDQIIIFRAFPLYSFFSIFPFSSPKKKTLTKGNYSVKTSPCQRGGWQLLLIIATLTILVELMRWSRFIYLYILKSRDSSQAISSIFYNLSTTSLCLLFIT